MAPAPLNCRCGVPARVYSGANRTTMFGCGFIPQRCKVRAKGCIVPVRYTNPEAPLVTHVSLELAIHPRTLQEAVYVRPMDPEFRPLKELLADVSIFPDALFNTVLKQWVLPLEDYAVLVQRLAAIPVLLEEVPMYVFDCKKRIEKQQQLFAESRAKSTTEQDATNKNDEVRCDSPVYGLLKEFQRNGVQFVLRRNGRAMVADEMGLGKTIQAICVAHHYRDEWPVLVVCPGSLCENWKKEFMKFCHLPPALIGVIHPPSARVRGSTHSPAGDVDLSIAQVVIVRSLFGFQNIKHLPPKTNYRVIIVDECHYVKSETTQRAKDTRALCDNATRVVLLSGTPAMSRPAELYNQIMLIDPHGFLGRAAFHARYCGGYFGNYGPDVTGHSNARELNMLLRHYIIRRTKKEVLKEMPEKARRILYVHVTNTEKDLLKKRVSDLANLASRTGGFGGGNQSDLLELKVRTAVAKLPAVRDYVKDVVMGLLEVNEAILNTEEGEAGEPLDTSQRRKKKNKPRPEKLIVFAHHTKMMDGIEKMLSDTLHPKLFDFIKITGETPAPAREKLCDQFRGNPKCAVALLSMQAMGTGHNLTCANRVVFTELDWNPSTHLQCEDRIHRIGQEDDCIITYLLADGTADEAVWPMLQMKLDVTQAVLSTSMGQQIELGGGAGFQDKETVRRSDVRADPLPSTLDTWLNKGAVQLCPTTPDRSRSPSNSIDDGEVEELIPAAQNKPPSVAPSSAAASLVTPVAVPPPAPQKAQTTLLKFPVKQPTMGPTTVDLLQSPEGKSDPDIVECNSSPGVSVVKPSLMAQQFQTSLLAMPTSGANPFTSQLGRADSCHDAVPSRQAPGYGLQPKRPTTTLLRTQGSTPQRSPPPPNISSSSEATLPATSPLLDLPAQPPAAVSTTNDNNACSAATPLDSPPPESTAAAPPLTFVKNPPKTTLLRKPATTPNVPCPQEQQVSNTNGSRPPITLLRRPAPSTGTTGNHSSGSAAIAPNNHPGEKRPRSPSPELL